MNQTLSSLSCFWSQCFTIAIKTLTEAGSHVGFRNYLISRFWDYKPLEKGEVLKFYLSSRATVPSEYGSKCQTESPHKISLLRCFVMVTESRLTQISSQEMD